MATERALYVDSSALVKLIVHEPESPELEDLTAGREIVASELVLAEVPRAIRRAAQGARGKREALARGIEVVLGAVALLPLDRTVLLRAGAFEESFLRALDAIHIATALAVADEIDSFVSYDARQADAARIAGLPVVSPGV